MSFCFAFYQMDMYFLTFDFTCVYKNAEIYIIDKQVTSCNNNLYSFYHLQT